MTYADLVDHLHARQRRADQIHTDRHPQRRRQPSRWIEHIQQPFPPFTRLDQRWIELRRMPAGCVADTFSDEPRHLIAQGRDQLWPISRSS